MQKRIVLNLKDIDFEEDSDEDIGWTPPQDYNEIEEKFFCHLSIPIKISRKSESTYPSSPQEQQKTKE